MPTTSSVSLDPETLEAVRGFLVVERAQWRTALAPCSLDVANELDRCIRWVEAEQRASYAELDASLNDRIAITAKGIAALAEVA